MAKKAKKIPGIEFKNTSKNVITMRFPKIRYPNYWKDGICVDIKNDTEFEQAKEREERLIYGGELIIPKGSKEAKELIEAVDKIWKIYDLDNVAKKRRKINPYIIEDGDEKADGLEKREKNGDIYRGHIVLKIGTNYDYKKNKIRFQCFDKFDKYMPKTNNEVDGYYVRVGLYIDYYNYSGSEGVRAYMNAVQFLEENPDVKFQKDYSNEFEFEQKTEEEKQDAFEKAVGIDDDDELPLEAGINNNTALDDQIDSDIGDSDPFAS